MDDAMVKESICSFRCYTLAYTEKGNCPRGNNQNSHKNIENKKKMFIIVK